MSQQADNPGAMGIVQAAQQEAMAYCRAAYNGTLYLREHGDVYLPAFEKEKPTNHSQRVATAVLFNSFKKTVKSLAAIVFREDPLTYEELPGDLEDHLENVDLTGQHIDVFALQQFIDKLIDGHVHTLVDWHGPEGARSQSDERKGMARAYWTSIRKGQVRRHWTVQDGGQIVLASFAYHETETVKAGEFAQKEIQKVRQYDLTDLGGTPLNTQEELPPPEGRRVLYRSWIQENEGGEWAPHEKGKPLGDRMNRIPLVTDYADKTGFMQSEPALLDLALENIKHFQIRSDRDQNLHVTSIPILNIYGISADELQTVTVGHAMGLAFPGGRQEQGSEYTEAKGYGLTHTREELLDIEKRCASLGLSMLERQTRMAETEEKAKMDQKAQDSELAAQARATAMSIREALQVHALWEGDDPEAVGDVSIDTDFHPETMSPEMFDKFLKAVAEGRLSTETMWDRLVAGRLLPDPFDAEEERRRIDAEGANEMAVMAEAMRRVRVEDSLAPEVNTGPQEEGEEEDDDEGEEG